MRFSSSAYGRFLLEEDHDISLIASVLSVELTCRWIEMVVYVVSRECDAIVWEWGVESSF